MINTNNQINPGKTGVDFSHLRKYGLGGITKYQTPMHGITYREGTSWYNDIFSKFLDDLKAILNNPNASIEEKRKAVAAINDMQNAYATIRQAHPNLSPVSVDEEVRKYQLSIIDNYGFVNTKGIANGLSSQSNRYIFEQSDPNKRISGDKVGNNGNWGTDGLYAGQTQDRTLLGYDGDWDETSDEFKTWQGYLNSIGLETYKGDNGAYLLRDYVPKLTTKSMLKSTPEPTPKPTPNTKTPYTAMEYTKMPEFLKGFFDSPIHNAVTAANTIGNAKKQYDLEMQKQMYLPEANYKLYAMTDNWLGLTQMANNAAEVRAQGARMQGASAELNNQTALLAEKIANDYEQQGQVYKNDAYNKSLQEATAVADYNNAQSVETGNQRRYNATIDHNNKIGAKLQYEDTRATTLNDMHLKNITDLKTFNAQEKSRLDEYNDKINVYNANKSLQEVYNEYSNFYQHPENSQSFNTALQNLYNYWRSGDAEELDRVFTDETGKALEGDALKQSVLTYFNLNPNSEYGIAFLKGFDAELNKKGEEFALRKKQIENLLAYSQIGIPSEYSSYIWNPYYSNVPVMTFKSGGKVSKKMNDRMYRYQEHNRKVNQAIADYSLKAGKMLQDQLNRRLDAIDRETLLLLRNIFK